MSGDANGTTTDPDFGAALRSLNLLKKPNRLCSFGRFLEDSPAEFRETLETVMRSDVSSRSIYIELTKAGVRIGRDTFTQHRTGRCICLGVNQ
jgi:hypothetical protein